MIKDINLKVEAIIKKYKNDVISSIHSYKNGVVNKVEINHTDYNIVVYKEGVTFYSKKRYVY